MRPEERERREQQRLASMARTAKDLGGVSEEVAERVQVEAERRLGLRCGGCGERIGVGLRFTRFEVAVEQGRPVVNALKMGACNGAAGCDFAETARAGADLVEMVEYVWLHGDRPVAAGELTDDVARASAAAAEGVDPN